MRLQHVYALLYLHRLLVQGEPGMVQRGRSAAESREVVRFSPSPRLALRWVIGTLPRLT